MDSAWAVFVVFVFFDCMQAISNGCLSGLQLTPKVMWVTTISYWVLALPLSCALMFHSNMSVEGLWYGPTLAVALNFFAYEQTIKYANWQEVADQNKIAMAKLSQKTALSPLDTSDTDNEQPKIMNEQKNSV